MQPYLTCCCEQGVVWLGGDFTHADGFPCHEGLVRIDADDVGFINPATAPVPFGMITGAVLSLASAEGTVWAAGSFSNVNPSAGPPITPGNPRNVVKYIPGGEPNAGGWQGYAYSGMPQFVTMATYGGALYAGGGGPPMVMYWNGQDWDTTLFPTTGGVGAFVLSIAEYGGLLYALASGGTPLIAAYESSSETWIPIPTTGIAGTTGLRSLFVYNGFLYLSRAFSPYMYRFTGTSWQAVGSGISGNPAGYMTVHQGVLHLSVGPGVYLFDGASNWIPLAGAINAGGPIASAGGKLYWTNGFGLVSRWNGVATVPVGTLSGAHGAAQAQTRIMLAA